MWAAASTTALSGWFAVLYPGCEVAREPSGGTASLVWSVAIILVTDIAPSCPPSKADANHAYTRASPSWLVGHTRIHDGVAER